MMTLSNIFKGIILAVGGSIFWGSSGVAAQFLLQDRGMTADYLTAIRTITAGLILLLIDRFVYGNNITNIWRDKASRYRLLFFGIFGMMAVQYTYFAAIAYSNISSPFLSWHLG